MEDLKVKRRRNHPGLVFEPRFSTSLNSVLAHCKVFCSLESCQGKSFKTVEGDFLEVVGRPHGSEGVFRIQHGEHVVVGRRAQLEYLDWATGGPCTF